MREFILGENRTIRGDVTITHYHFVSSLFCLNKEIYCITVASLLLHNLALIMISMHNGDKFYTISLINIFCFHA